MRTVFLSSLLCLLLVCTSCTSEQEEPLSFSLLYNDREAHPFSEDWLILQEYQKRMGVRFEVILGDDDDYHEALVREMGSSDPPEVILKIWPDQVSGFAEQGRLLPVSDYTEYMPWFNAYVQEHGLEAELERLRMADGKYYILPGYKREIQVQQWVYRKDLFEKHGLGIPENYDELFAALVVLKEQYPHSSPMSACWEGAHLYAMMSAGYGITGGWNGYRSFNEGTGRWEFSPATDAYRQMYRFLHRCVQAGLLYPDELNQSSDDFYRRIKDGDIFFTVSWISSGLASWNRSMQEKGLEGAFWAPIPVLESTIGISALPPVDRYRKGLAINSAVKGRPDFEKLLSFIDWAVYSPEGRLLTTWGVEGETFEQTPAGPAFLEGIRGPRDPDGMIDPSGAYGLDLLFNLCEDEYYEDHKRPEYITSFLKASLERGDAAPLDPPVVLSSLEREALDRIRVALDDYVKRSSEQFLTGEMSLEDDWVRYVQELERLGYRSFENLWNRSLGEEL